MVKEKGEEMRKLRLGGVLCAGGGFLLWLGAMASTALAQDELPIGLPDFPRRVQKELPALRPDQEIRVGALKLHPSFRSTVVFDDNVKLAEDGGEGDVIFTQKPGLVGELGLGDHRLEAGYGIEFLTHAAEEEEDTTSHLAHGLLELNFTDLQFTVADTMEDTTGRLLNETAARDHVLLNTVQTLGRYDRPAWALEGGWTHNTVDHRTDIFNTSDYGEDVLALLGGYKIFPKTLFLLETDVGLVNYDSNVAKADHSYWQMFTGIRGELTPKVTSTIKLGFQDRQLSDVGGTGPQSDFDGIVADMELVYTPSVSDVVRMGYLRTVRTSTFGSNGWYRQDKLFASYRKRFSGKWLITPRWSWQFNDYPELGTAGGVTDRREDHFFRVGADLRYLIQEWLSTGVAYDFRSRNSNLGVLDYENNRLTFDVTLAF
jgi:hypothetical protein